MVIVKVKRYCNELWIRDDRGGQVKKYKEANETNVKRRGKRV